MSLIAAIRDTKQNKKGACFPLFFRCFNTNRLCYILLNTFAKIIKVLILHRKISSFCACIGKKQVKNYSIYQILRLYIKT